MFFKKFQDGAIRDRTVDHILLYGPVKVDTLGFSTEL